MSQDKLDLANVRQEYMRAGLSEAEAPAEPLGLFGHWMADALARNLPISNAMTLATVRPDGSPDARIVLLKELDATGFVFYTNYESAKGTQLAAHPRACLVFY